MPADYNVALKAVLLKYVPLDQLDEATNAVLWQFFAAYRADLIEKLKGLATEEIEKMGYKKVEE